MATHVWVLVGACCCLSFACSTSDSGERGSREEADGAPALGDAGASTGGFGDSACGKCVAETCSSERDECGAEPACASYVSCLEACGVASSGSVDPECEASCRAPAGGAAKAAFDDYDACRSSAGCAACGAPLPDADGKGDAGGTSDAAAPSTDGGGKGDAAAPPGDVLHQVCAPSVITDACLKCSYDECCRTNAAFDERPDAELLDRCVVACKDASCKSDCFTKWPDEVQTVLDYNACNAMKCSTADTCATSDALACLTEKCAEPYVACKTDRDCFLLMQCRRDCTNGVGTTTCYDACDATATPSAMSKNEQYALCLGAQCS